MNNSANAGLQDGIDALIDVKEDYEADGIVLNWADLMALAGQIGAEYGMEGMQGHMDYSPGKQLFWSARGREGDKCFR